MHRLVCTAAAVCSLFALGCEPTSSGKDASLDPLLICDTSAAAVLTPRLHSELIATTCVATCHEPGGTAVQYGEWETAAKFQAAAVGIKSAYAGSAGELKVVHASKPENSSLMLKVLGGGLSFRGPKGEAVGARMPSAKPELSEAQKKQVRDWICQGAKAE